MLFSFIGINPDFLLKVMGDKLSIFDIQSEFGENIKEVCDKGDASVPIQNAGQLPFKDNLSSRNSCFRCALKVFCLHNPLLFRIYFPAEYLQEFFVDILDMM